MLTDYIHAVMRGAKYKILPEDDNLIHGEIPGFEGISTHAETLAICRQKLVEALKDWICFRVSRQLPLPVVEGIQLPTKEVM
jgi:predicted RNase H-like HicB family nuclease